MSSRSEPPAGVYILCALATVNAVLMVGGGLLSLLGAGLVERSTLAALLGLHDVFFGSFTLVAVFGLLTLQRWGWLLAMALYGVTLAARTLELAVYDAGLLGLLATLAILGYLVAKRDAYASGDAERAERARLPSRFR